jgi:hypothetical protein
MSNFFENDNVRREMEDIYEIQKDLYNVIMQFPSMSDDAKWEHIETLKELLEKQQIMWTRVSYSEDPEAIDMKKKIQESAKQIGFGVADMNTIFGNMKNTLNLMQTQLKR